MPNGGKLIIETAQTALAEHYADQYFDLKRGRYAVLRVSDTGSGMTPEVQAHIFEPFFTTKPKGRSTGLGLSTVYGIVKQSGGAIFVDSEPGRGTSFRILLPAVEAAAQEAQPVSRPGTVDGTETILVVEDDEALRKYLRSALEVHGYTVLVSENGRDALELARQHQGAIDLLLTDAVMPEMAAPSWPGRLPPYAQVYRLCLFPGTRRAGRGWRAGFRCCRSRLRQASF
jgi:hypothetical protein